MSTVLPALAPYAPSTAAPSLASPTFASLLRPLLAIFIITGFLAFAYPAFFGDFKEAGAEEEWLGRHLAQGHGFLMPIDSSATAQPSSWSPPIYPAWIALTYKIWGIAAPRAMIALWIGQAVLFGFASAALYALGRLMGSKLAAWLAVIGHCAIATFIKSNLDIWDHYAGVTMFLWLLVGVMLLRRRRASLVHAVLLGAGLAVLSLTNAGYVLSYPLLVLVASWGRRSEAPKRWLAVLPFAGTALAAFLVVLGPWTIRNYHTFHRVFYVRAGAPMELWMGNIPGTDGWLNRQMGRNHPNHNSRERREMIRDGEIAYFDHCQQRFIAEIARMPGSFISRCLRRSAYCLTGNPQIHPLRQRGNAHVYQWSQNVKWPDPVSPPLAFWAGARWNPVNTLVNLAGIAGAVVAIRRRNAGAWMFFAALLAVAPFTLACVENDHILQIRSVLMLFAAYLIATIVGLMTGHRKAVKPGRAFEVMHPE